MDTSHVRDNLILLQRNVFTQSLHSSRSDAFAGLKGEGGKAEITTDRRSDRGIFEVQLHPSSESNRERQRSALEIISSYSPRQSPLQIVPYNPKCFNVSFSWNQTTMPTNRRQLFSCPVTKLKLQTGGTITPFADRMQKACKFITLSENVINLADNSFLTIFRVHDVKKYHFFSLFFHTARRQGA